MRTNIDIDDELMAETLRVSGKTTKKAAVEEALRQFVLIAGQVEALREMRGLGWEGSLEEMRNDWTEDTDWGLK